MKKDYIAPCAEFIRIRSEDIITASDTTRLPWVPLPTDENEMIH